MKLVICGQDSGRLEKLKEQLKPVREQIKNFQIATVKPSYVSSAIDNHLTALVFDTEVVSPLVFSFIKQIRKMGFNGPILMLGHLPKDFKMYDIASVKGLYFLKKPFQDSELCGMVKNAINIQNMRQRRDQRFDVHEQATLEAYSSDFKTETVINNISRSGVRIQGNVGGLQEGDLLRLHFNFDKINKERTLSARVVWVKSDDDSDDQAGLEFVSQKAVYQFLLGNAAA